MPQNTTSSLDNASTCFNATTVAGAAEGPLSAFTTYLAVATFCAMSLIALVLYGFILAAIVRNRVKFGSAYYKFIFTLGIAEIIMLLYQGPFNSFCLIRGLQLASNTCEIPEVVDRILASISWWAWMSEYTIDPLIAFDRFVAIVLYNHHARIFAPLASTIMCICAIVASFADVAPIIFWYVPAVFVVGEMGEDYESWDATAQLYDSMESAAVSKPLLALSIVLYAVSITALLIRRRKMKKSVANGGNLKAESKLLIQGVLRYTTIVAYAILWVADRNVDVWAYFAANVLVLAVPLNTTLILVCLNGDIRSEIMDMLSRFKPTSHQPASTVTRVVRWASDRSKVGPATTHTGTPA